MNGTLITNSSNTYPYRAYLDNLLSYGPTAKYSKLTCELFYEDEPGKMDKPNPLEVNVADNNKGLAAVTARSRRWTSVGRIQADIFFQNRYMLDEVNIKIKLTRSKDSFCLIAVGAQAFKVKITSAASPARKVKISPSVYLAHAKTLESGMANYPIRRVVCKTFTVPAGHLDVSQEELFSGKLPTRLILGCVDNRAFNGDLGRNPFHFQFLSLRTLSVYLDGQQIGMKPIAMNYTNNQNVTSYMSLFNGVGKDNRDEGNDIAKEEYANRYALYAFDLSQDLTDSGSFSLARQVTIRVDLTFGEEFANTISTVAYASKQAYSIKTT